MSSVLKSFDLPSEMYADDVRDILGGCVARFGEREWRLVVLTNEIHGHLGIYSTLGAKMGLRAAEYFEALGIRNHISILSFAGSEPPVSCFNDGLQISTGSTVGHGLIAISGEDHRRAEALFESGGAKLRLALKPVFEARIREDIADGTARFGRNPDYWSYVRSLALKYWAEWDRNEIFDEII